MPKWPEPHPPLPSLPCNLKMSNANTKSMCKMASASLKNIAIKRFRLNTSHSV